MAELVTKRRLERKISLGRGARVLVAAWALSACGGGGGEEAHATTSTTLNPNLNRTSLPFNDNTVENNVLAECDGRNRVYVGKDGKALIEVIPDSPECDSSAIAQKIAKLTFGDNTVENNVLAECDGTTRVYRAREAASTADGIIAIPRSSACISPVMIG